MSWNRLRRSLKALEQDDAVRSTPSEFDLIYAEIRALDTKRNAALSMLNFALALVGPVERPQFEPDPEPRPESPFRSDEFRHLNRPPAPRERKAWYDPSYGGRIMSPHGGLGNSVDAIFAMPPQPVEEIEPLKPPKPGANPWGLIVPDFASEETKRVARSYGWLPPEEMPIEDGTEEE